LRFVRFFSYTLIKNRIVLVKKKKYVFKRSLKAAFIGSKKSVKTIIFKKMTKILKCYLFQ